LDAPYAIKGLPGAKRRAKLAKERAHYDALLAALMNAGVLDRVGFL